MIEALVLGKLQAPAVERFGATGRRFVTARVRVATSDSEVISVSAIAFGDSACVTLLALEAGDAVAIAGTMKLATQSDGEGKARPCIDIVASTVTTIYGLAKKRRAAVGVSPTAAIDVDGRASDPGAEPDGRCG